jgi:thiamine-phosphate pyrophosphorylase
VTGARALPQPPLLVITDRTQARRPLAEIAETVFAAGCRWLLLREKDLDAAERLALTKRLVACALPYRATVSVSADPRAAREAMGLHLPRGGDVAEAREMLGPESLVGQSAHDLVELRSAAASAADYATLSPIFASASKPGYGPAHGLEGLRTLAAEATLPVIALGGVDRTNARACLAAGAAGLAVMGEVMRATAPEDTVRDLLSEMEKA